MKQILILFLVIFSILGASQSNEVPKRHIQRPFMSRIVNGSPADIAQHPHHVALFDLWQGSLFYFCGGSIISTHFVLSAAHCLRGARPEEIIINGGSNHRTQGAISFIANGLFIHPQYDSRTLERDIGILRTPANSPLIGTNVAPIKLPNNCNAQCCQVCQGVNTTVTGFGRTETGSSSQWLLQVSKPVFNFQECDRIWSITDGMFCTDATLGDSCSGDSGGPVLTNDGILQGVVSFGSAECDGSRPAVYVRLEAPINRNWIREIAEV